MTTPTPTSTPVRDELLHDERWALTQRLIANHQFAKAVHLRELLLYLAKRAIACPHEEVSEQEIGWRVLGRRPDYNSQADNIVRVQIRRLRQKLDEYFLTDGRDEPMVIVIPKGSHVLRFERRAEPAPIQPPAPARKRLLLIPLVTVIAVAAFFAGRLSTDRGTTTTRADIAKHPLWSRLFVKDQPASIVIADSSFVVVQNVLQQSIRLNDYIDRSYRDLIAATPNPAVRDILQMISNRQYTSLADATLSSELRTLGSRLGSHVTVRYARHMNIRDFNSGNFILVGSSHGVPWVELFEPGLNFQFERIGAGQRFGFHNKKPMPGEEEMYESSAPLNGPQQSYATVSILPNLSNSGTVLLLTGITMEATEAAGEFAMSPEFTKVLNGIAGPSADKLPRLQVLLKASSMAGAPHKIDVVALRKLPH